MNKRKYKIYFQCNELIWMLHELHLLGGKMYNRAAGGYNQTKPNQKLAHIICVHKFMPKRKTHYGMVGLGVGVVFVFIMIRFRHCIAVYYWRKSSCLTLDAIKKFAILIRRNVKHSVIQGIIWKEKVKIPQHTWNRILQNIALTKVDNTRQHNIT